MGTEAGIPELGVGSAGAAVYGEYEALLNQVRGAALCLSYVADSHESHSYESGLEGLV